VGASLGGFRVAQTLRRLRFEGPITLVGDEPHLPYDRPPLSKEVLTTEQEPDDTRFRPPEFFEEQHITLRLGAAAVGLDPEARLISLACGETLPFDAAVIATGARPRRLPGTEGLPHVQVMRNLDDSKAIRSAMDGADHLVVVGAGFIGSEVAASARSQGLEVTILEKADQPLAMAVGPEVGRRCAALHGRYGTRLRCGIDIERISSTPEEGPIVHLAGGASIPCDLVVVGIGVIPNLEWLEGSGIETDHAVICDPYMRTSLPGVYALGDLASWHNPHYDERMRVEHWTNTVQQATTVARNILADLAGDDPTPYTGIPYFWSDQYGHRLQLVGRVTEDVVFVHDPPDKPEMLALYRDGDQLSGAFAIDTVGPLMQMRTLLLKKAPFNKALEQTSGL